MGKPTFSHAVGRVLIAALFAPVLILSSCKKDRKDSGPSEVTDARINQFIVDTMRMDYLWIDDIPSNRGLNLNQEPARFFPTILSRRDRFSWIQDAQQLHDEQQGIIKTSGMSVSVVWSDRNARELVAAVQYVLKGSPADRQGVERGDLFVQVNGRRLLADERGRIPALDPIFGNDAFTIPLLSDVNGTLQPKKSVTLSPVTGFVENAILVDTVWTMPSGRKVGYVFYNRFLDNQRQQLIDAFGRLKGAGIQDLVLDMRYNGGGGILAAAVLSGLIHKNFDPDQLFIKYQYNRRYFDDDYTYRMLLTAAGNHMNAVRDNNLGLDRVFVLATGSSASASELVMNNIKPFIGESNVIHIGETTYGKNVGSMTIDIDVLGDPTKVRWAIQPIMIKLANADGFGDYEAGFTPSVANRIDEWDFMPWEPLGSIQDPLVARALAIIEPELAAAQSKVMSTKPRIAQGRFSRVPAGMVDDPISRPVPVWLDGSDLSGRKLKD